jgi:glycosyltransferase involved in cell wall biosynthesis
MPIELNSASVDALLQELKPDLAGFDRFMLEEQFGWRVSAQCPDAKRMVDTIDLHSLRDIRRRARQEGREPDMSDWFSDLALRELASIYRSDLSLLISDREERILTEELNFPASLLHVLPFLCTEEEQEAWRRHPPFSDRNGFVTIGNFRHPPNADSVRILADALWPRIREACPGADLHVFGADLTPALRSLHRPESGFHLLGRAEDAVDTLAQYRICLAPLRFGAGCKGKLLDAMRAGTPSVTTPIGAEGMQGDLPWPGAVEENHDTFVQQAVELYRHESAWITAQSRIPGILRGRFDRTSHAKDFRQRIRKLMEAPPGQTADQLPGALLRHHQHRSTEYMSRWIELKNQSGT